MDNDINKELINRLFDFEEPEQIKEPEEQKTIEPENPEPEKKAKKGASVNKLDIYDFIQCVISALVVGIMVFIFVFRVIGVKGDSMKSTLHNGDRVVASGILYKPEQGDIIILKSDYYDQPLVKRIIATENQTIDIDFTSGIVYVDGQIIDEPYIYEPTYVDEGFKGPVTVPEGCVFVMGDNRNESNDSRSPSIGFVDEREIFGKVLLVLLPTDGRGGFDWDRFGTVE